jgi:H/ACA ribonucleoprotein complex subunit 3
MRNILKCGNCKKYTMGEICQCGGNAATPKPAKFSIEDKYGTYRRKAKSHLFKERGYL